MNAKKNLEETESACEELFEYLGLKYECKNRKFYRDDGTSFTPSFFMVDVNVYIDASNEASEEEEERKKIIQERYPSDSYHVINSPSEYELMYLMQFVFGSNFTRFQHLTDEEKEERTKHFVLALQEEIIEALRCINRKDHVIDRMKVNRKELLFELIDVKHFYNTLCLIWDYTPQEIFEAYKEKNKVNWERWRKRVAESKKKIQQKRDG